MKTFNELIALAKEYARKVKNKNTILYDPIFRIEDGNLCLEYLIVEFNDEFNNDYRIKRPIEWFTQDILSGEILNYYNVNDKDYSLLPLGKLFDNNGESILYDQSNDITRSFQKWQKDIIKQIKEEYENSNNLLYDEKVMKIENTIISPKEYILSNIDSIFEKMFNMLFEDMGNVISYSYNEYFKSLFNEIRNKYINDKIIDKRLIKQYMNFLKYSWPESLDLFNNCTNIKEINDECYDNAIIQMLEDKKLKRVIENPGIFPVEMQIDNNYTESIINKKEGSGDE